MGNQTGPISYADAPKIHVTGKSSAQTVLKATLQFLEKYGWQRGATGGLALWVQKNGKQVQDGYSKACLMGGILAVTENVTFSEQGAAQMRAIMLLTQTIDRETMGTTHHNSIIGFNDSFGQTKNKVFGMLRKAIGIA